MRRTTPEDMRPTMTAWFEGARDEAIAFACVLAAEISDDPDVPHGQRRNVLLARLEAAEEEELANRRADMVDMSKPMPPRGPAQQLMIRYRFNKYLREH